MVLLECSAKGIATPSLYAGSPFDVWGQHAYTCNFGPPTTGIPPLIHQIGNTSAYSSFSKPEIRLHPFSQDKVPSKIVNNTFGGNVVLYVSSHLETLCFKRLTFIIILAYQACGSGRGGPYYSSLACCLAAMGDNALRTRRSQSCSCCFFIRTILLANHAYNLRMNSGVHSSKWISTLCSHFIFSHGL